MSTQNSKLKTQNSKLKTHNCPIVITPTQSVPLVTTMNQRDLFADPVYVTQAAITTILLVISSIINCILAQFVAFGLYWCLFSFIGSLLYGRYSIKCTLYGYNIHLTYLIPAFGGNIKSNFEHSILGGSAIGKQGKQAEFNVVLYYGLEDIIHLNDQRDLLIQFISKLIFDLNFVANSAAFIVENDIIQLYNPTRCVLILFLCLSFTYWCFMCFNGSRPFLCVNKWGTKRKVKDR